MCGAHSFLRHRFANGTENREPTLQSHQVSPAFPIGDSIFSELRCLVLVQYLILTVASQEYCAPRHLVHDCPYQNAFNNSINNYQKPFIYPYLFCGVFFCFCYLSWNYMLLS
jgi:hypothetical protein